MLCDDLGGDKGWGEPGGRGDAADSLPSIAETQHCKVTIPQTMKKTKTFCLLHLF